MESQPAVPWWQRLLLAFCATILALLTTAIVFTCLWLGRTPADRHWFTTASGGGILEELRIVLIAGGIVALGLFIFLAAPLVLLWPVRSQLKHWHAFLCVAAWLPVLYLSTVFWHHPVLIFQEFRQNPGGLTIFWPAIPFVFGIACYLLLLRRSTTNYQLATSN